MRFASTVAIGSLLAAGCSSTTTTHGNTSSSSASNVSSSSGSSATFDGCNAIAANYDQICQVDSNCVGVFEGDYCTLTSIDCPTAAVSVAGANAFDTDVARASGGKSLGNTCTGIQPKPCCRAGKCQPAGACFSTHDTGPICAALNGQCNAPGKSCFYPGPSGTMPGVCAFPDEPCCLPMPWDGGLPSLPPGDAAAD